MGQTGRRRSGADHQDLRGEIIRLRRDGLDVDRGALATKYNVSQRTVTIVRNEVDTVLEAAMASDGANRRTVQNFDGSKLYHFRRGGAGLWLMQDQLGRLAGVSRGEIGHLERGQRKPTIRTLCAIAEALGVEPAELLHGEEAQYGETLTSGGAGHRAARLGTGNHQAAS